MNLHTVSIIGAGQMGAGKMGVGIAQVCAQAGYSVLLSDVDKIAAALTNWLDC